MSIFRIRSTSEFLIGCLVSRYPAKKHYPSDILMGATIGYVTGTYLTAHASAFQKTPSRASTNRSTQIS